MAEQPENNVDPKEALFLKLDEPQVSQADPWADDALGRDQIAQRLTNLIAPQSAPFTISIHGNWGTGKTFLLKRWEAQFENDYFETIYFNASEDVSSNDPLLAILRKTVRAFQEREFSNNSQASISYYQCSLVDIKWIPAFCQHCPADASQLGLWLTKS